MEIFFFSVLSCVQCFWSDFFSSSWTSQHPNRASRRVCMRLRMMMMLWDSVGESKICCFAAKQKSARGCVIAHTLLQGGKFLRIFVWFSWPTWVFKTLKKETKGKEGEGMCSEMFWGAAATGFWCHKRKQFCFSCIALHCLRNPEQRIRIVRPELTASIEKKQSVQVRRA